jgi:deoxyribodipyrimidine photo-lyase
MMHESSTLLKPVLLWFRLDLRVEDNPALQAAIESGRPIVPVYILDVAGETEWSMGGASYWWLHHALKDLDKQLRELGASLILRRGDSKAELQTLLHETGATSVYWNRRYEPQIIERDKEIKQQLLTAGFEVQSFNGSLLHEPHTVSKKDGTPYKVFTPYWKYCLSLKKPIPVKADLKTASFFKDKIASEGLDSWELLPTIGWDEQFYQEWDPTVVGAKRLLRDCVKSKVSRYECGRDLLGEDGTSKLSPYLHFGQLSPRQIWQAIEASADSHGQGARRYLAEIGWREFSYYLLYHFPHTPLEPMRPEYQDFPWDRDEKLLTAWQKGETGFPVVDAGMRQLWKTGWMHNRARMITASFLVKHLLQPWQDGARWFWDTLVDADLASNTQGWQWTAGCGADASPYFRIFNPILQGEKFDPEGDYVRRWVPELEKLPNRLIHKPWEADALELAEAGLVLGKVYPFPVIEHSAGRARALKAYELFKVSMK